MRVKVARKTLWPNNGDSWVHNRVTHIQLAWNLNILHTVVVQNSVAKSCEVWGVDNFFAEKLTPDGLFIQPVHGGNLKLLNFPTICPFSLRFPWKRDKKILQDYTGCKMNFLQKRTDVCLSSSRDKRLVCVSSPANLFCSCVPAQNWGLHCPVTPVTDSLLLSDELQL